MSFPAGLLPLWLTLLLTAVMLATLSVASWQADWHAVRAVPARLHLLCGCTGLCLLLWTLSIELDSRVQIHLLGMTAVTLILGLRFALLCGSVALLARGLLTDIGLAGLPAAWLCTVAVPALLSRYLVTRLTQLPQRNLLVYTLGGGFAGGILSALAAAVAGLLLIWLADQQPLVEAALENSPLLTLLMFPEGFINGMLLTAVCVFYPGLVKTFDDRAYIDDA